MACWIWSCSAPNGGGRREGGVSFLLLRRGWVRACMGGGAYRVVRVLDSFRGLHRHQRGSNLPAPLEEVRVVDVGLAASELLPNIAHWANEGQSQNSDGDAGCDCTHKKFRKDHLPSSGAASALDAPCKRGRADAMAAPATLLPAVDAPNTSNSDAEAPAGSSPSLVQEEDRTRPRFRLSRHSEEQLHPPLGGASPPPDLALSDNAGAMIALIVASLVLSLKKKPTKDPVFLGRVSRCYKVDRVARREEREATESAAADRRQTCYAGARGC